MHDNTDIDEMIICLGMLGASPDAISHRMHLLGIRGALDSLLDCPLAAWLSLLGFSGFFITHSALVVDTNREGRFVERLEAQQMAFIREFDSGKHPKLIDQASNHQHPIWGVFGHPMGYHEDGGTE